MNQAILQYKLKRSDFDPFTIPETQRPQFTEEEQTLEHVNAEHTELTCLQDPLFP